MQLPSYKHQQQKSKPTFDPLVFLPFICMNVEEDRYKMSLAVRTSRLQWSVPLLSYIIASCTNAISYTGKATETN